MMAFLSRTWPHLAVIVAIATVIWWIDDNAADRTRDQLEAQRVKIENKVREDLRQSEQRLTGTIHVIGAQADAQVASIEARHETIIKPTLVKELTREIRFSDPAAGITDGVRTTLNRSLANVACAARPDGGIRCALPDARPVGEQ